MIKSAIRSFISLGVFAAACLVPLSPAQTATPVVPPVTPASPTWKINCPGVPNVPMTADSEQSLPLQLVATLKCSEEVTVLDNSEGYTARIKTADGKTGYVAVMYLKKIPAPRRAPSMESANIENGAARWEQSAPGCDSFMSNSILVESLTANGITVQVSLHDTGWKLRANIAIANSAAQPVRIVPSQFILDDVGLNGKPLFYNDPAQLAKNVTHQVLWTETVAAPANPPSRSPSIATTSPIGYKSSFAPSLSTQNYLLPHQYAEDDAVHKQGKQTLVNTAKQVQALALKPATIQPNDKVTGAVWFDRGKNPQQLVLRIPVENQIFEFPLSFKQQK